MSSSLIFNKDHSIGGYLIPDTINTTTFNGNLEETKPQTGGNIEMVSSLFKGLAVPMGLFALQQSVSKKPVSDTFEVIHRDVVDNDLYETLFHSVSSSSKKKFVKKTRRNRSKLNKKTRKSK